MSRDGEPGNAAFLAGVVAGLNQRQKAIPARWFYDRRGSELFDDITRLAEYYPTRSETDLLTRHGADLARHVTPGRAVIEFGSGSSTKTPLLLGAIDPAAYVPIDISGDYLRDAAAGLAVDFPQLAVHPLEADFTTPITLPAPVATLPKIGFFPGSTIGNLVAASAIDLLRTMRATLGDDAMLLIGMDRIKDEATLIRAYDDGLGVTAAFNLNLLDRINRELGGDIPVDAFDHVARWNEAFARIEMHLVATRAVDFGIGRHRWSMDKGQSIHTENSHKYGPRDARLLLVAGGWTPVAEWDDCDPAFALILAKASEVRTAP